MVYAGDNVVVFFFYFELSSPIPTKGTERETEHMTTFPQFKHEADTFTRQIAKILQCRRILNTKTSGDKQDNTPRTSYETILQSSLKRSV